MLRRPPAEGRLVAHQRKIFLALAVILLPWLQIVDARQQQQSPQQAPIANILKNDVAVNKHDVEGESVNRPRHDSSFDGDRGTPVGKLAATFSDVGSGQQKLPKSRKDSEISNDDGPNKHEQKLKNSNTLYDANALAIYDANPLATLAPAQPVRAPNSLEPVPSFVSNAGLSSLQSARSLENWEVEDYIILATVDGHLYTVNRDSGDERWHLVVDQPVVETVHHRRNRSVINDGLDEDSYILDDYIWVVEPSQNGAVYVWSPSGLGSGLMHTGLTMKKIVDDMGPWMRQTPPVVYTGHKKSTLYTIDAATGRVLKWFGQTGSGVDQDATCFSPKDRFLDTDSKECSDTGTITLSRTEYIVTIHRSDDGREIATLKYAEWGPNNFDNDLHQQYRATYDDRYITSRHDGSVFVLHPTGISSFTRQFSTPVARVFDVARRQDAPYGSNPELVLLPQPTPPLRDEESSSARGHSVLLNQTGSGSWYAMSGWSYPLIVDAPNAVVNRRSSWKDEIPRDILHSDHVNEILRGVHTLESPKNPTEWQAALPPGLPSSSYTNSQNSNNYERETAVPTPVPDPETEYPGIVDKVVDLPRYAADSTVDFLKNPILLVTMVFLLVRYHKEVLRWIRQQRGEQDYLKTPTFVQPTDPTPTSPTEVVGEKESPREPAINEKEAVAKVGEVVADRDTKRTASPVTPESDAVNGDLEAEQQQDEAESPEKKTKRARGRRGGVKHKKGAKKQRDASEHLSEKGSADAEETIPGLNHLGAPPKLEPNITTLSHDPEDVSGPVVKIGGIEVNQDEQLGMGSNGTVVFAGKFHGRDVAVKRMLTQFWEIATQETQLLLESDDHPNVIRYFAMSKNDSFLYIALELCQASLSDIVDKPHLYPVLAKSGEQDLPRVLLQIAHGLGFLHDLRIVHRDLKPQNILVAMGRDGKPRLLVSDFGLCKKLEGGQSSFGATTAHAAGTSGWRAPELLLDDDARDNSGMTMSMTSTHSDSSSHLVSSDVLPNRRATRAIDIFSLGLVFFYVLTKGLHPFDCGDRYMREVNIRKGQFNLDPLDVLGDYAPEAKALIRTMIQSDPRMRPSAKDVMAHPFFWSPKERLAFLCDVSDHFELEQRDPPSKALLELESHAPQICRSDFLRVLPKEFVESLGKQRKYTGTRLLDLLRALRNKRFHYGDMSEPIKKMVGSLPEGYLGFWTRRFPNLLIVCCMVIYKLNLEELDAFKEYFKARTPL